MRTSMLAALAVVSAFAAPAAKADNYWNGLRTTAFMGETSVKNNSKEWSTSGGAPSLYKASTASSGLGAGVGVEYDRELFPIGDTTIGWSISADYQQNFFQKEQQFPAWGENDYQGLSGLGSIRLGVWDGFYVLGEPVQWTVSCGGAYGMYGYKYDYGVNGKSTSSNALMGTSCETGLNAAFTEHWTVGLHLIHTDLSSSHDRDIFPSGSNIDNFYVTADVLRFGVSFRW